MAAPKSAGKGVPVVVGGDEDLEMLNEQFSLFSGTEDDALQSAARILAAAERLRASGDFSGWPGVGSPDDFTAPDGDWPAELPSDQPGLTVSQDIFSGSPKKDVHILLVPAKQAWEVPAYLHWGGWNECPAPEFHVVALQMWHERFGAELVGINGDTMNVQVARKPVDRDAALLLAREQYQYCPDIVDQGTGTLASLAAALMTGSWWFFWWD